MKRRLIPMLALTGMLLGGCAQSVKPPLEIRSLPPVPADIQACFVGVVDVPDRPLTVAEVERLWKQDRVRSVVMQRCGKRLLAWYGELRADWQ